MSDDMPEVGKEWFERAKLRGVPTGTTLALLFGIIYSAKCKPGWDFQVRRDEQTGAWCLVISVMGPDSRDPKKPIIVSHWRPIPLTTFNAASWKRWLFDKCQEVEAHELGEWFRIGDERPFQPLHGPGEDPYTVHELRPEVDFLTTQDGSVRKPYGDV